MSSGSDENQLDYSLYKLEQVVYLSVCSQNIWPDFLTDEVIQLLLTAQAAQTLNTIITTFQPFIRQCMRMRQDFRITPNINYAYSSLFNKTIAGTMELLEVV